MSHRQTPCQGTNGHLLPSRIGYVADRGGLRNSCIAAVRRSSSSVPSSRVMTIAVLAGPSTWLMVSARMATRCGRTSPSGAVAFWTRCPASSNAGSRASVGLLRTVQARSVAMVRGRAEGWPRQGRSRLLRPTARATCRRCLGAAPPSVSCIVRSPRSAGSTIAAWQAARQRIRPASTPRRGRTPAGGRGREGRRHPPWRGRPRLGPRPRQQAHHAIRARQDHHPPHPRPAGRPRPGRRSGRLAGRTRPPRPPRPRCGGHGSGRWPSTARRCAAPTHPTATAAPSTCWRRWSTPAASCWQPAGCLLSQPVTRPA
jgi:hypothetical protein